MDVVFKGVVGKGVVFLVVFWSWANGYMMMKNYASTLTNRILRKRIHLEMAHSLIARYLPLFTSLMLMLWGSVTSVEIAWGGVTESQVVVAINGASDDSRTIANHYVHWRNIPGSNVIVLNDIPDQETITVDQFRDLIVKPLFAEIDRRGLNDVKCIAYSAGFPTAIQLEVDLKGIPNRPIYITPVGSINGLTMLSQFVFQKSPSYLALDCNLYARRQGAHFFVSPFSADKSERWRVVDALVKEGKHKEAAEAYEAIFVEMPNQFPSAYLAATQYALAGEKESAIDLLETAVDAGWVFREKLEKDEAFASLQEDARMKMLLGKTPNLPFDYQPTVGFESRVVWGPNGVTSTVASEGLRHVMSTVLAVTRGQGTTVAEALAQLKRSIEADGTHPQGTFYYTLSGDVRTKTRQPAFDLAIRSLKKLGHQAEVVEGTLPSKKEDCIGLMIGAADFDWPGSGSSLKAGAIAENLTSLGGIMTPGAGQTKLSAFLRGGAAGSSGTVTEPYAIQAKFPHPMIQAHYAEGATLAEAFYLSVLGPYQLLIVGDPLCKPFLTAPEFDVEGLSSGDELIGAMKLKLKLRSTAKDSGKLVPPAKLVQFMFDSRLVRENPFVEDVSIGLDPLGPGYHEVAVISTDDSLLRRQYEQRFGFYHRVAQQDFVLELPPEVERDAVPEIEVQVGYPQASSIELYCYGQPLGKCEGEKGTISIPSSALGLGPVPILMLVRMENRSLASAPKVITIR